MLFSTLRPGWRVPFAGFAAFVLVAGAFAAGAVLNQAAAQPETEVIYACRGDRSGVVRIVAEGEECQRGESLMSWNAQGPQGVPGLSGYQRVVIEIGVVIPSGVFVRHTIACPAGSSVLGGGANAINEQNLGVIDILHSYPDSDNSWTVNVQNISGIDLPPGTISYYATCATVAE